MISPSSNVLVEAELLCNEHLPLKEDYIHESYSALIDIISKQNVKLLMREVILSDFQAHGMS